MTLWWQCFSVSSTSCRCMVTFKNTLWPAALTTWMKLNFGDKCQHSLKSIHPWHTRLTTAWHHLTMYQTLGRSGFKYAIKSNWLITCTSHFITGDATLELKVGIRSIFWRGKLELLWIFIHLRRNAFHLLISSKITINDVICLLVYILIVMCLKEFYLVQTCFYDAWYN